MIIDEARSNPDARTLYFYFRSTHSYKRTFVDMARSLLSQILRLDPATVSDLYESVIADGDSSLSTRKSAEQFLDLSLKDLRRTYIILDGLDECKNHEQKAIVSWLQKLVDTPASVLEPNRCLILSQYDSSTRSLLSMIPTIAILTTDTAADIESYCYGWEHQFTTKFRTMARAEFNSIAQMTYESAKGEFQ